MADQAINALSTKTAPETSDQLLLVGTGEPQLIDYDKLADAILNKITSKNYALDAGQMTLLAALNKLNSESTISSGIINRSITFPISKMHSMVLLCVGDPNGSSIIAIRVGDTGIQGTQLLAGNNTKFTYACVNKKITVTAEENLNYYGRYIAIS